MSVLVCVTGRNNDKLLAELSAQLPNVKIYEWPHCENLAEIEFVLAWKAPETLWAQLPNLQVVQSYGAGVDAIGLSLIPEHVQVTRIVDTQLAEDMAEYVLTHTLAHKFRIREYLIKQQQELWKPKRAHSTQHVGILGMGELGLSVANKLISNNFKISGWSRSEKQLEHITHFHGDVQLSDFLKELDVLVCLLPLTPQTEEILNLDVFKQLPDHCLLINVARGKHLNESDLLTALDQGELAAAVLDVFTEEPLPKTHPFWSHSKITITPHCAALTQLKTVCEQIADNVKAQQANTQLRNLVCKQKGY